MNLTPSQILALTISTLSVLGGASAQLTTLFGQGNASIITTACALVSGILGGWIAVLSGQANIVKQVAAMPGVDRVAINTAANQTLAAVAVDPQQPKIGGTDAGTQMVLKDKAKGE